MSKKTTDFGAGLCYCVGMFIGHAHDMRSTHGTWLEVFAKMYPELTLEERDKKALDRAAQLTIYGAADHLIELHWELAPKGLRKAAKSLHDRAMQWRLAADVSHEDIEKLFADAKEFLRRIDVRIGAKPIRARYT